MLKGLHLDFPVVNRRLATGLGGDDAANCLRYLIAAKGRTVSTRKLRGF